MTSFLHLKSYAYTQLSVKANPEGALTVQPKMDVSINYAMESETDRRVKLGLNLGSSEKGAYGYDIVIQMEALISVNKDYPIQNLEHAACVNTMSILFSAAREILLSLTSRCIAGPVFLPTINFAEIVSGEIQIPQPAKSA